MDASQVVTCKALSLAYWRITGEASSIGVPLRFLSTKKIKGTMEEKVKIIQTANGSDGTTIYLAPDVAYIEATFEDRLVSRVIVKMKEK